jgi:DNA-binding NarL/FixJ family response regulator
MTATTGHDGDGRLIATISSDRGTILIADGDAKPRSLTAAAIKKVGYAVVEVDNGDAALDAVRLELPHLVILEVNLPRLSGYEVCHQLKEEFGSDLPIILVSGDRTEPFDRVAGMLIGADDYMVKPLATDELLVRVRRLVRSRTPIAPALSSKLTRREGEVLRYLAEGFDAGEIASHLFISRRTVSTHLENIMRKLGVRSRAQAVALFYREQLATRPESEVAHAHET